jgi:uncharacterized protein DUF4386
MTRTTNARLAGFTFLFYIAVAFPQMILWGRATNAHGAAAKLALIAEHATDVRIAILLSVLACFSALVLAVTLYGITRDEDQELAMLGFAGRAGEGIFGAGQPLVMTGLLWLSTSRVAAPEAVGALLLKVPGWSTIIGATFFAAGSTFFAWLLLRGRMIPVWLAWVGVIGSAVLVISQPLQLAGLLDDTLAQLLWIPVALFELTLGPWLLIKGVA